MGTNKSENRKLRDFILILLGIGSAGFGLKGFLLSSHFIDGGATGISMLIFQATGLPLSLLIPVINLPFILLAYRQIGKRFAFRSTLAIAGLSVCLAVVPFPDVTPDLLLTAVFGGFFIGAGIGLAMRGGAVLDGTEALALLISRKSHLLKVSDVILLLNLFIFAAATFLLGVEEALYSMITYFAASKTIDFLVHGMEQYTGILIVSENYQAIKSAISQRGWGITILKSGMGFGKRGHQDKPGDVLYAVVTRLEIGRLISVVQEIDHQAFLVQFNINDVQGGKIKSRAVH
ncbi:YitT family protein [Telluribacter sp. SYSU D00476]|uniref:YitT family protein n=1 Tax=Telluribacter sp. SYSU D00476 TaxID=2811430 RepID=UPI001FF20CEF|nr:YitT family protein [Telluribacter sp. SYSU D00476]